MTARDLGLLVRTAAHLRPAQLVARVRLRGQRAVLHRWPDLGRRLVEEPLIGGRAPVAAGWPADFVPGDALARDWPAHDELRGAAITLLGRTRELTPDWAHADAPQLWRFHLHYWDWAWGLEPAKDPVAARAVFARLWRSWQHGTVVGQGDAWAPYVVSLRAWSWCGMYGPLVAGTDLEPDFLASLAAHARFLRWHLESDVGGNHLMKNLKAVVALGLFLGDERAVDRGVRDVARQVGIQVLADGGHYERAPAYHCQVLADLVDVAGLLRAAGRAVPDELDGAITRMREWLGAVLGPDGRVPMLNDGYPVSAAALDALHPAPPPDSPDSPDSPDEALVRLPDTGLVAATAGRVHLLADVGDPCPPELPAHAHADTLSFLLWVDGDPLLVDTGTSTYAPGARRQHERSTPAHNTVTVDGQDSSEVWGAFRVAARARATLVRADVEHGRSTIVGRHDGYARLRPSVVHERTWSLDAGSLTVSDRLEGSGDHTVALHWHLAPGVAARTVDGDVELTGERFTVRVSSDVPGGWQILDDAPTALAEGFDRLRTHVTLRQVTVPRLPSRVVTTFSFAIQTSSVDTRRNSQ